MTSLVLVGVLHAFLGNFQFRQVCEKMRFCGFRIFHKIAQNWKIGI